MCAVCAALAKKGKESFVKFHNDTLERLRNINIQRIIQSLYTTNSGLFEREPIRKTMCVCTSNAQLRGVAIPQFDSPHSRFDAPAMRIRVARVQKRTSPFQPPSLSFFQKSAFEGSTMGTTKPEEAVEGSMGRHQPNQGGTV